MVTIKLNRGRNKIKPRKHKIEYDNQKLLLNIHRRNCKHLRIVISPDLSVNVYTPKNASEKFIHESVTKKAPWILRSIEKLEKCRVLPSPEKYITGENIAYLGGEYRF